MAYLKYVVIAIVAFFIWHWLRGGASASANVSAQMQPSGWGSGMVYAPGSAVGSYPYGYPWAYPGQQPTSYAFGGQVPVQASGVGAPPWYAYLLNAPINVGYSNGGFGASYGN